MGRRRLTESDYDTLAIMREEGATCAAIAAHFGVSPNAISWHCMRLGAEPPDPPQLKPNYYVKHPVVMRGKFPVRAFTPQEDEQLLALEADGLTHTQIGRRLGRRPNSIRGRLMTLARRDEREAA